MHPEATKALDRMDDSDSAWIEHAVEAIRIIAVRRGRGAIMTSDPVWALLGRDNVAPPKEPRAMGSAFRRAQTLGYIESTNETRPSVRDESHHRPVRCWRIL